MTAPISFVFLRPQRTQVDTRFQGCQSSFFTVGKRRRAKIVLPLAFLFGAAGIYFIWGFFHPKDLKKPPAAVAASPGASSVPASAPKVSDVSPDWRLRGWYTGPLGMVAMLEDNEGRLRHVYMPSNMRITGLDASLSLDGVRVSKYSGTVQANNNAPQVMP